MGLLRRIVYQAMLLLPLHAVTLVTYDYGLTVDDVVSLTYGDR